MVSRSVCLGLALFATATASVHDEPLATITVNGTNVWHTISSEDGKWLANSKIEIDG